MTVIETPSFLRDAKRLIDDEERQEKELSAGEDISNEVNHERQPHH
jgi:hypothetical protein